VVGVEADSMVGRRDLIMVAGEGRGGGDKERDRCIMVVGERRGQARWKRMLLCGRVTILPVSRPEWLVYS
jgi:hypothetical protein